MKLGSSRDVVAKVLNYDIVVCEFKLQSCDYVHFWINTLRKAMHPLIPQLLVK